MIKTKERGWAGHFCLSDRCLFRRNTLVYCDQDSIEPIVVSTVGNLVDKHTGEIDVMGLGTGSTLKDWRYFETFVMYAKASDHYLDADHYRKIELPDDVKDSICADHPNQLPKDVDNQADAMHDGVVDYIVSQQNNLKGAIT